MLFDLRQEIANGPDKNPRVPEEAFLPQFLGALSVRFLYEALDRRRPILVWLGWLDVAKPGIRAGRNDTNGDECVGFERDLFCLEQSSPEFCVVTDRPVGVNRNHRRILSLPTLDGERGPGERCRSAGGTGFSYDVLSRYRRQQSPDRFDEAAVRQDQRVGWIDDRRQSIHGVHQQRLPRYEGKQLFGTVWRAERPEA